MTSVASAQCGHFMGVSSRARSDGSPRLEMPATARLNEQDEAASVLRLGTVALRLNFGKWRTNLLA
jgi:hypothetical protein